MYSPGFIPGPNTYPDTIPEFAQMLNEMRLGRISEQTAIAFKQMSRPLHFDDGLEVTEL
jgi:ATP-dependent DNA helicase PIF1